MATKISSKVVSGDVFIRTTDMINSLYEDLTDYSADSDIGKYIRAQIDLWKAYEKDILKQAENRNRWF